MARSDHAGLHTPLLNSTEAWLLFASLSESDSVGSQALFNGVCQKQWSGCIQFCNSVDIIEKVLAAAFEIEGSTSSDCPTCQQQLLAKSLDPALNDQSAGQLLQKCLVQGPFRSKILGFTTTMKHLDHCITDLCCTSVQGAQGMLALRQREACVYATILSSSCGWEADLAKALTGYSTQPASSILPHDSKLHELMQHCFHSIHATEESRQKAVRLMGACALAHPSSYSMLMPTLQHIMWTDKSPDLQFSAAAGILDGMFCHIDNLSIVMWQTNLEIIRQMLESQQSKAAGLQMAAIIAIGRLLIHEAQVCADLGQTEQLVALLVQIYVQPDQAQHGTSALAESSQQGAAQSLPDECQQALHLFFQQYSTQFADELANTCVLIICNAIADAILVWDAEQEVLHCQDDSRNAHQDAAKIHLQCKFLTKLLQPSNFPMQAIYDAVCANVHGSSLHPDGVKQWLHPT